MGTNGMTVSGYATAPDGTMLGSWGNNGTGLPTSAIGGKNGMWSQAQDLGDSYAQNNAQQLFGSGGAPRDGATAGYLQNMYDQNSYSQRMADYNKGFSMMGAVGVQGAQPGQIATGSNSAWVQTGPPGTNQGYWSQGSGSSAGGSAANAPLFNKYQSSMMDAIDHPGAPESVTQGIINKGTDELSEAQRASALGLSQRAEAFGGGQSGGLQSAMRTTDASYAGQKQGLARDTRLAAEQTRQDRLLQSLGVAGSYLGHVQDNEAQANRQAAQLAHDDANSQRQLQQNMAMMQMNRPQPQTPDYSHMISTAGQSSWAPTVGYGGGANKGTNTTQFAMPQNRLQSRSSDLPDMAAWSNGGGGNGDVQYNGSGGVSQVQNRNRNRNFL